jgi:uncharacterized delta-60 repeat protein
MRRLAPGAYLSFALVVGCGGGGASDPDAPPRDAGGPDGAIADAASFDGAPADAAPPGTLILDPSFGASGLATAGLGRSADDLFAAAVQPDGKLVLAGVSQLAEDTLAQFAGEMVVARLAANGAPDPTFGVAGVALVPVGARAVAKAVAVQADGRIVVAGEAWFSLATTQPIVARLLADGSPDPSFGTGGVVVVAPLGTAGAVAVAADGTIVVAGSGSDGTAATFLVARLTANGALDAGFAGDGVATTAIGAAASARAVALATGGGIVAAGYTGATADVAVARYLADGTLDTAFGGDGIVTTSASTSIEEARAVAIDATGRVLIAGTAGQATPTDSGAIVIRYEADGDLDPTFGGGDGIALVDVVNRADGFVGLHVRADGRIVAAGAHGNDGSEVVRFLADGTLDATFGTGGTADPALDFGSPEALAVAGDGSIHVAATHFDFAGDRGELAASRMSELGVLDTGYGSGGRATLATGASSEVATDVVVNPDGTIVTAGFGASLQVRRAILSKHLAGGALDPTFGAGGRTRLAELATTRGMARTTAGALVVAGDAPIAVGLRYTVARYDATGALDPAFATAGVFTDRVALPTGNASPRALALDASERIIVVGNAGPGFSSFDAGAIRLLPDGTLDPSFGGDGRVTFDLGTSFDELSAVDVAPDGTIVAIGRAAEALVVRLEADGDLDPSFGTNGVATPGILGAQLDRVRVQADGAILVAGYRQVPASELVVARLTPAGTLDPTFGTGGVVTYANGGPGETLLPFGNRWLGPELMLDGGAIRVAGTVTAGDDESIVLLSLDAQTGAVVGAALAGAAGYWAGFDGAVAPGGAIVIAGRGFSPVTGTDLGVARFAPAP